MARQTFNISLPDEMARQVDRATKRENRSRSELVREALRVYLRGTYTPTADERRAIEKGRAEVRAGEYLTLEQLHAELERLDLKERREDAPARPKARARTLGARAR
jgi:predicted transcriptional regulator